MLRIGLLGCARIVRRAVAAGIKNSGVAGLTAIASRNHDTARAWAKEFGAANAYGSYGELLDDPGVDAVYIPLPNELHPEWTSRAAAAGKHVLCEKPLARTLAEAEEMVAVCRRHGVILMEAFMYRHHPRVIAARQLVADGKLGELRLVKMDFSFQIEPGDWRLDPARGGGALFDLGCYGINAARYFIGSEPVEVLAAAGRGTNLGRGVDMTSGVLLRFASGALGVADASFECPYRNRIEIVGSQGTIELPDGVLPPSKSQLILRSNNSQTLEFTGDQYAEEIKAFAASIAAGGLIDPAEDGLANMRVLDAAKKGSK